MTNEQRAHPHAIQFGSLIGALGGLVFLAALAIPAVIAGHITQ